MKKILCLILAGVMVLTVFSCGKTEEETETESQTETEEKEMTELEKLQAEYDKIDARLQLNKYEAQIEKIEARTDEPREGGIVFFGASWFTRWQTETYGMIPLSEAIPASDGSVICLNHGFGGSCGHEQCYYFDRMVTAYKPKAVVLGNFTSNNGTPQYPDDEMFTMLEYCCEKARTSVPGIHIYLGSSSVNPSTAENELGILKKLQYDERVKKYCEEHEDCTYYSYCDEPGFYVSPEWAGTYKNPNPALYVEDNVHLNQDGYHVMTKLFTELLHDELQK